ncbi:MAG: CoA-binding protein, partial [Bacteroidales bacterium]
GNAAFKEMAKNQYILYPVHPEMEAIEGVKCYKKIADLPDEVQALLVSTSARHSLQLVKEAHEKGIAHVWLQQGSQNDEAIDFAIENNINLIQRQCILMFANPVEGIHKFHRGINKFFGVYPR